MCHLRRVRIYCSRSVTNRFTGGGWVGVAGCKPDTLSGRCSHFGQGGMAVAKGSTDVSKNTKTGGKMPTSPDVYPLFLREKSAKRGSA